MDELAQDIDMSHMQACINLEKATQFITQLLQRQISRNQELCVLVRRLEERGEEAEHHLAEQVEANQQLRLKIDELNEHLKERDGSLTQAHQTVALLRNEQRDLQQQLQQHRTLQEVNEWLQGEEIQVNVESPALSAESQERLEVPVCGIKVEEEQNADGGDDGHGENRQPEDDTYSRTEHGIPVAVHIKTELIKEEDTAPDHASKTNLPFTDACPTSPSPSKPEEPSGSFSHLLHKDNSFNTQLRSHQFPRLGGTQHYHCNQCNQTFPQQEDVARHQCVPPGQRSFCCAQCGRTFHQHASLSRHLRAAHSAEAPRGTSHPDQGFSRAPGLVPQHVYSADGPSHDTEDVSRARELMLAGRRPYSSSLSDKGRVCVGALAVRQQQAHTGQRLRPDLQCDGTFASIDGKLRQNHHQAARPPKPPPGGLVGEKRPYQCAQCGRRFTQLRNLRTHEKFHTGERLHGCAQCGKSFTSAGNLRVHQRVHTGERPYACTQCGRSFTHEGNLKAHQRTHTGEKPHRCGRCGRSFTRSTYVKLHQCVYRHGHGGQSLELGTDQIT